MAQGLEPDVADEWVYTTLHGDATLMALISDVFSGGAGPEGATFPFATFQNMSGMDLAVVGAFRIWTDLVYLVKVVGHTADFQSLKTAVARIDVLLHRSSGTTADGTIWACVREQTIRLPEVVKGDQYRHSGGLYRLYAT